MWPAVIQNFDKTLVIRKHKSDIKTKIQGFLKQLRSYSILCHACCFCDLLEKISIVSKIFKANDLLSFEIQPIITTDEMKIENLVENAETMMYF